MARMTRRQFLKRMATGAVVLGVPGPLLWALEPALGVKNPFKDYPSRDWEKLYRDMFRPDDEFTFVCTPNCTHNCYLKATVKNGVITRVGPTQNYHKGTDLYGTQASQRWDPRLCNKGTMLPRRFYGDRRVKGAMVRRGYKKWAEQGFPRDSNGLPPGELFNRGEDTFEKVSWDEATKLAAASFAEAAQTYSGQKGAALLKKQDYDPAMIKKMDGAGTRAMKFRGGMPVLGSIKLFGQYRQANSMALLDSWVRKVGPKDAKGAMGFDNYTWHTDLPPGHPMVTGQQTVDFDLCDVEYCDVAITWGMNWICTKMPDAHWLTEAKIKGKKIINITTDYNATSSKSNEVIVIRPGTDPALAMGVAHILIKKKMYNEDFVKNYSDLPMLVRMDNQQMLRATDAIEGYQNKNLKRTRVVATKEQMPLPYAVDQDKASVLKDMREDWGDKVIYDLKSKSFKGVSRDDVGTYSSKLGFDPALEGSFKVKIKGKTVTVKPVFQVTKDYLDTWTPATTSKITWAPQEAILSLARTFSQNPEKVLTAVGMGPNQMFNADQKDRAILLVATLTRNIGFFGGNVGSYAGNYRAAYFNGMPQYMAENPFDITLDKNKPAKVKNYFSVQSAHYYSHGDQPLKVHGKYFNGDTHMPTPTKSLWFSASNSLLGNAKGHYDLVMNLIRHPIYRAKSAGKRMIDTIIVNDWWWTGSCEYADIVFGVDSWGEYNQHDLTNSCTNPFAQVMPKTKINRIHDTRSDSETYKLVAAQLAKITGDNRFNDYWFFINKKDAAKPYIQRIFDHSNMFKGYKVEKLLKLADKGIPALMMGRTYPKYIGYEQSVESMPWYTKSGRLEFYREEKEFRDYGENMVVYREPIDSTFYRPNTIIAEKGNAMINPKTPKDYGFSPTDMRAETLQVRNEVLTPDELLKTQHPLMAKKYGHTHIWITPKYRHSVHTMFADLDIQAVWWGPFGDMYRKDKRKPFVGEGCIDINPKDAKAQGIEDGDYIWVDADPRDLPFKGWQERPNEYKVARCMLRARYYPGMPRNVTRSWFNLPGASFGSVKGAANRKDGQAKSQETGYQAMYRFGSHQSGTRSWLRPTLLTDSMVRKDLMGQGIGKGFAPDVHCANGAPRESFVKFEKAEDGGESGKGLWSRAKQGQRPTYESKILMKFIKGGFIQS